MAAQAVPLVGHICAGCTRSPIDACASVEPGAEGACGDVIAAWGHDGDTKHNFCSEARAPRPVIVKPTNGVVPCGLGGHSLPDAFHSTASCIATAMEACGDEYVKAFDAPCLFFLFTVPSAMRPLPCAGVGADSESEGVSCGCDAIGVDGGTQSPPDSHWTRTG